MLRLARLPVSGYETLEAEAAEPEAAVAEGGEDQPERVKSADIKSLETLHRQITKAVGRRLPSSTLSVLAQPSLVAGGTHVDWLTDLEGQPLRLDQLKEEEQKAALALLQERLTAIDALADTIAQEDEEFADLAPKLKRATQFPGLEDILVVSGNPIILFWGHRRSGTTPLGPQLTAPGATGAGAAVPPTAETDGPGRRRLLPWAALALLVLSLGLGALWWFLQEPDEYELLLARLNTAQCDELRDIIQIATTQSDDPRYQSIVERGENRLQTCEYQRVAALLDGAAGNCDVFRRLKESEPALNGSNPAFQPLRDGLTVELATCEYDRVARAVADSKDDCPASADLLTNEPLLQNEEQRYATLLSALEERLADCDYTRVRQAIEDAKNSCDRLNDLKSTESLLSPPEGRYLGLAERLDDYLENCEINEARDLIKRMPKECRDAFKRWKRELPEHKAFYLSEVWCAYSWRHTSAYSAQSAALLKCGEVSNGKKCVRITSDVFAAQ